MRYQGRLQSWNDDKGFGFVEPNGGGQRCFVHISQFVRRTPRPEDGELIVYDAVRDEKGKWQAENIERPADRKRTLQRPHRPTPHAVYLGVLYLIVLAGLASKQLIPLNLLWVILGANLLGYMAYARDKAAAQSGAWRVKESTLHLFALLGGWPAAALAQQRLRHKSAKASFRRVYWATVIIHISGLTWWLTHPTFTL